MVCGPRRRHSLHKSSFGCVLETKELLCHFPESVFTRRARKSFSEVRREHGKPLQVSFVVENFQAKESVDKQRSAENEANVNQRKREGSVSRGSPYSVLMELDATSKFIDKYKTSENRNLSEPRDLQRIPLLAEVRALSAGPELPDDHAEIRSTEKYCATTVENYKSSLETEGVAAKHVLALAENYLRVSPCVEFSHDQSTTTNAIVSFPDSGRKTSCALNTSPPTPLSAELDEEHLGYRLIDNIPSREVHLGQVLENWAEARTLLCRLRSLRIENPWMVENWDFLFKPFLVTANDMYLLVTAFRDSSYCPLESRLPGNEDLEPKELTDPEEKYLVTLLREAAKILKFVYKSCTRPDWSEWFRLLNLRQDCPDRRKELEVLAGQLEVALREKGIIVEDTNDVEKISGALKSASQVGHGDEKPDNSQKLQNQPIFSWIGTISPFFESDCMSIKVPVLAKLKYQRLKRRFRSVPISVAAPSTVVDSSSNDITDWKMWVKRVKEEKGTLGDVELDDEDRNNIAEAILTYQKFRDLISGQHSVGGVLLSHKVTTRIRRYENRLQGRTHMCAVINVRIDYACDSNSQPRNSSLKEQDTTSDKSVTI